ncbi:MAG: DUF4097 family beta strand repeat protein [Clostridia bacterium]|nr:DUF4097 family beta strand repeat protein [Clostridia bacterium]
MTRTQRIIKYVALALAIIIIIGIIGAIVSAVALVFGIFGKAVDEETTLYTVSDGITDIEIEIPAADFEIKTGAAFSIESNLKYLRVEEVGSTLKAKEKSGSGRNYDDAVFVLTIPEGKVFESADVTTGAGRFTVETLSAKRFDLELGAGEVNIRELNALQEADIAGGAGKVTISGGTLNNLEFEMGVGELNLTSKITGESDIDLGVGEANLRFLGSSNDYTLRINKAVGSIMLDGKNIKESGTFGSGAARIEIDGGVGAINVAFSE